MTENSKEINKPLTSKNDFGEVSMLPNKWWFLCTSILSLVLYYFDMITDYIMLDRFLKKLIQSNQISQTCAYTIFFYSSLLFTILPILSLILFSVLKTNWKELNWHRAISMIVQIFVESFFNIGLIKL